MMPGKFVHGGRVLDTGRAWGATLGAALVAPILCYDTMTSCSTTSVEAKTGLIDQRQVTK